MVDASEYHAETDHTRRRLRETDFSLDRSNQPRPFKRYTDLPRRELPDPADATYPVLEAVDTGSPEPPADAPPDGDAVAFDARELHTLCHYATGITKELERRGQRILYRAAACTGKLYHVDLYAVVGESAPMDAGVYHFEPIERAFDVLRDGDYRAVLTAASGGYDGVATAPVTLVATSEWWRNAWKYRARTYRHAFWDSGTILANLLATAHARGHRAEVVAGFADDPLVDLLGLDPDREAPLELVALGSGAPPPDESGAGAVDPIDPETTPLSDEVVEYPLVQDAWRQSRLDDGAAANEWRDRFGSESPGDALTSLGPGEGRDLRPLSPVDRETASARPVDATVERRGSLREYAHDPISERKFATVLDRALGPVPMDCFGSGALSGLVDTYCLVHAVDGIEQGCYEYHPGECALERVGDTTRERAGELALGQSVVGDAAVNVYLVADVEAIVERFGNRGYRLAQLEGGIALGRLYLATYAHRTLGGRGFTFFDEQVAEYLSPHADGQVPMTLFAFGKPRT